MSKRDELLQVEAELKQLDSEIKYHKDEFNESIRELTEKRKELQKDRVTLREGVAKDWDSYIEPIDGISMSYRKDFIIKDEFALEWKYLSPDLSKIRKELVDSEWTKPIDGVKIIEKPSLRISKKDL